jgi:hypothetical protein
MSLALISSHGGRFQPMPYVALQGVLDPGWPNGYEYSKVRLAGLRDRLRDRQCRRATINYQTRSVSSFPPGGGAVSSCVQPTWPRARSMRRLVPLPLMWIDPIQDGRIRTLAFATAVHGFGSRCYARTSSIPGQRWPSGPRERQVQAPRQAQAPTPPQRLFRLKQDIP